MVVVMLGAPGTGKGTISKLMSEYYEIPHIATGDLLRSYVNDNKKDFQIIKEYMANGELLPDIYLNEILEDRIAKIDTINGFILDGYPRTIKQAKNLENILRKRNMRLNAVINLDTPDEEIIERILNRVICPNCGSIYNLKFAPPVVEGHCDKCDGKLIKRDEDTEEKIQDRLRIYDEETKPLIEYYEKENKIFKVLVSSKTKMGKEVLKDITWYLEGK